MKTIWSVLALFDLVGVIVLAFYLVKLYYAVAAMAALSCEWQTRNEVRLNSLERLSRENRFPKSEETP